jgi:hypothetical protein
MNAIIALLMLILPSAAESAPDPSVGMIGQCDPIDGPRLTWTREARRETRRRVQRACRSVGASPAVCAFADAVVIRESAGRAGVRHTLGTPEKGIKENGLGAMGLSLRWHADKWPGKDEDPAFCVPEASFIVAHSIMWRAVTRYRAANLLEVQAIYAGRWDCYIDPRTSKKTCRADPSPRTVRAICGRLRARGHSCYDPITKKDLGEKIPLRERRSWVDKLVASLSGESS